MVSPCEPSDNGCNAVTAAVYYIPSSRPLNASFLMTTTPLSNRPTPCRPGPAAFRAVCHASKCDPLRICDTSKALQTLRRRAFVTCHALENASPPEKESPNATEEAGEAWLKSAENEDVRGWDGWDRLGTA